MPIQVEYTDEFGNWWNGLSVPEQESVRASVELLRLEGTSLRFPHTSGIVGSRHSHMRELRIQHQGRPYRVLYAFDPRRDAILRLVATKRVTTAGTQYSFPSPTTCTMSISRN